MLTDRKKIQPTDTASRYSQQISTTYSVQRHDVIMTFLSP